MDFKYLTFSSAEQKSLFSNAKLTNNQLTILRYTKFAEIFVRFLYRVSYTFQISELIGGSSFFKILYSKKLIFDISVNARVRKFKDGPLATRILLRMSMKWAKKVGDPNFFLISYQDTESDLLKK